MGKTFRPTPSVEWICARFRYDSESGKFYHARDAGNWRAGDEVGRVRCAGTERGGYVQLMVDYKPYAAHRIAWKVMTGEDAPDYIDHINGDRADNRWSNLRTANAVENGRNRKMGRNNTTGKKGVTKVGDKFRASICVGTFRTLEEASAAYDSAAASIHGEYARLNADNDNHHRSSVAA